MLSNIDIMRSIKSGEFIVEPFDQEMLKPNAIFFRLDNAIAETKSGRIDPIKDEDVSHLYNIIDIEKQKYELKPGDFILARTFEKIALGNKLAMLVEGRSTLARLGISVTQTAMVIESGHGFPSPNLARPRKIVLEISNVGPFTVKLTPKMKIAKGTLFSLEHPTDIRYDAIGRYGRKKDLDDLLPVLDGYIKKHKSESKQR